MKKILLACALALWCLPALAAAGQAQRFFLGMGCGEAALNNDLYIFSADTVVRQPELGIRQKSQYRGPAISLFAGSVFAEKPLNFLGDTLQFGIQCGYAELGEYTIEVEYTDSQPGYRKLRENALDLLLTSSLRRDNGFNLFAKAGVARLQGSYEQKGVRHPRQPELLLEDSYTCIVYRPELAFGVGYIFKKVNFYLQYNRILGPEALSTPDRFTADTMVDLPNTLYQVDSLTVGASYSW